MGKGADIRGTGVSAYLHVQLLLLILPVAVDTLAVEPEQNGYSEGGDML